MCTKVIRVSTTPKFSRTTTPRTSMTSLYKTQNFGHGLTTTNKTIRMSSSSGYTREKHAEDNEAPAEYNSDYLQQQFLQLNQEIAQIQWEVKPLRSEYMHLQKEIVSKHQPVEDDEDILDDPMKKPQKLEDYQSVLFKFQSESNKLKKELAIIKEQLSKDSIETYEKEEARCKDVVESLSSNVDHLQSMIEHYRTQINTYRLSKLYDDIQRQKDLIQQRKDEIAQEREKAEVLQNQLKLFAENEDVLVEIPEDVNLITRLKRKLENTRRKHYEKCEVMLALRNKQVREINEVNGMMRPSETVSDFNEKQIPVLSLSRFQVQKLS